MKDSDSNAMKDTAILLKLINLLADGKVHSGEQLSKVLCISRIAIKKYIQTMCNLGIDVFIEPDKAYCLYAPLQLLDERIIRISLLEGRVVVLPIIDSTNQYLIERIGTVQPGDACVAEYQAKGRGRRGRQWISPFGNNLYLSLYWCFKKGLKATSNLSLMIGIIIAEMLQNIGAKGVRIKWPNDLYLNNRKLAGILVEISGKTGDVAHVVIGAGINLAMRESVLGTIHQEWIDLKEIGVIIDRNTLTAKLINTMRQALQQFEYDGFTPFFARWKALDNFFNRQVKLLIGEHEIKGIARGINAQGALLLEREGKPYSYLGGNISLRCQ